MLSGEVNKKTPINIQNTAIFLLNLHNRERERHLAKALENNTFSGYIWLGDSSQRKRLYPDQFECAINQIPTIRLNSNI